MKNTRILIIILGLLAVSLPATPAPAQSADNTVTYYFHWATAPVGNVDMALGGMLMDREPPTRPVPGVVHPSAAQDGPDHRSTFDASWFTADFLPFGCKDVVVTWYAASLDNPTNASDESVWNVQVRIDQDQNGLTPEDTVVARNVTFGAPSVDVTEYKVTFPEVDVFAGGNATVIIEPVAFPGTDVANVVLFDSPDYPSRMDIVGLVTPVVPLAFTQDSSYAVVAQGNSTRFTGNVTNIHDASVHYDVSLVGAPPIELVVRFSPTHGSVDVGESDPFQIDVDVSPMAAAGNYVVSLQSEPDTGTAQTLSFVVHVPTAEEARGANGGLAGADDEGAGDEDSGGGSAEDEEGDSGDTPGPSIALVLLGLVGAFWAARRRM